MVPARTAAFIIGAFALVAGAPNTATATELKLAHFVSPKHPYHSVFVDLASEVSAATGGKLTIRVFPGGELGANPDQQMSRAINGIADIAFIIPGYTAAQFRRTVLVEFPGVEKDVNSATDALWGARKALAPEFNRVKLLSLWTNNPGVLFMRDKQVRTLADIKGLKIRVSSKSNGDMVQAWGATPVYSPVTEMYNAIQTGVVDGVIIDPGAAIIFKLNEICNSVTVGMNATMISFGLVMNRDSWDALPDDQKAVLDKYAGSTLAHKSVAAWGVLVQKSLDLMASSPGKQVITLDPAEAAKFNAASATVLKSYVAELDSSKLNGTELLKQLASVSAK